MASYEEKIARQAQQIADRAAQERERLDYLNRLLHQNEEFAKDSVTLVPGKPGQYRVIGNFDGTKEVWKQADYNTMKSDLFRAYVSYDAPAELERRAKAAEIKAAQPSIDAAPQHKAAGIPFGSVRDGQDAFARREGGNPAPARGYDR